MLAEINIIVTKLKFYFKVYLYYFLATLVSSFILPFLIFRPRHYTNGILASRFLKQITKVYGIEWHLRNREVLAKERDAVVISNHQFSLDIIGVNHIWEAAEKLAPIIKKEIIYYGPFGWISYLSGGVFIDRTNSKKAYESLQRASKLMKEKKKGAFNLAVTAQVPIIPIVYSPYYFIDREKYIFNKGHIILQCLEPVPTTGLTLDDVPALSNHLRQIMIHTYQKLTKEVLHSTEIKNEHDKKHV